MEKGFIVITGAGKRVGFHIATHLLKDGYKVIVHYRSTKGELDNWLVDNSIYRDKIVFCKASFPTDINIVTSIFDKYRDSIVGLINSAAIFNRGSLLDIDNFREHFEINSLLPLQLSVAFSKSCRNGFVINIIDANIKRVNINFQSYRLSKIILENITTQLAVTLGSDIRVNGISPGTVISPDDGADESYKKAVELSPLGKQASISSLLSTVSFLIENSDITGEIISVDGGVHCI